MASGNGQARLWWSVPVRVRERSLELVLLEIRDSGGHTVTVPRWGWGRRARRCSPVRPGPSSRHPHRAHVTVAQLPALGVPTWGYDHYAVPAAWETSDLYLVNVRDFGVSALVRCSVSSDRCWRVVRTTAALRTERGHESIVGGNPTYPRG